MMMDFDMDKNRLLLDNIKINLVADQESLACKNSLTDGIARLKKEGAVIYPQIITKQRSKGKEHNCACKNWNNTAISYEHETSKDEEGEEEEGRIEREANEKVKDGNNICCGKNGENSCCCEGAEKSIQHSNEALDKLLEVVTGKGENTTEVMATEHFCQLNRSNSHLILMATSSINSLEQLYEHIESYCLCRSRNGRFQHPPVVVALLPGHQPFQISKILSRLLRSLGVFWVPFGWLYSSRYTFQIFTRIDLWPETCFLALQKKQIQPFFIEV